MNEVDLQPTPDVSNALARAVGRISEQLSGLSGTWMSSRDEIATCLLEIVREVERICAGDDRGHEFLEVENPVLYHRLTEALRTEVLHGWRSMSETGDPVENDPRVLLTLVWALEAYRARIWTGDRHDLATRLAEPDALELVVQVAHDLRSPLNSILFLAEVLRSGQSGAVAPHQRAQLGLIYGATMGMIAVVNDVMELASDPKGAGQEEPSPFSIGRVFDSVHEVVRPIAEEKGIGLEFTLPDYDHCLGRPAALGGVVLNLTINALKFTEEGQVSVAAQRSDRGRVAFSVRDSGRGIAPEVQSQLFQPFQRSRDGDNPFFAQAGLGLSIARRLVRAMGSDLTFESELDKGTVFSFTLDLPSV